ncbi:MAG TPA: hypothetical protein VKP08_10310, partial [Anaerolineales bacterium]|nr:hypothetical protein [Anaerolineales bacterium]
MKRFLIGLLSGILILAACTPVTAESTIPLSPTSTPTMVPATLTPSRTQIPPTRTVTPLPTIPTFTPTFDASTIVTVTPAAKAECPEENPSVVAKFATPNSDGPRGYIAPEVLDYLNSGGTGSQLRDLGLAEIRDFNKDGVNEVVFTGFIGGAYIIFGCKSGEYQDFLDFAGDSGA